MEPFIVGVDITDVNQLYGRGREIETLISCAKRKGNAGIIGARRFGKTCILKSLQTYLSSNNTEAYPLYFDVKTQCGVKKNTAAVFRAIASLLASKMCSDALLPEGILKVSRRCFLEVSCDELDMRVQMEEWNSEYQKQVLFTLAKSLSDKKRYLLLLLDEIDYLLLEAFENPSDFSRIRGAATDKEANLKFWIAGTSSWSSICTNVGSPELNCGLENVTLTSLSKEDFTLLWETECSLIEDITIRNQFLAFSELMYAKTGGIPYYAKFVASHMYTNKANTLPAYDIIRDYLCEIVNNRFVTEMEHKALFSFVKGPKSFTDTIPDGVISLKSRGLISISENSIYGLSIGYLEDYIKACGQGNEEVKESFIEQKELNELVGQIERLRISLNKKYGSANREVFLPSDEDPIEFRILRERCHDEASMDSFSGSLYKLYYEGSDKGNRLPSNYKRSDFTNLTRALRHMYNHRECEPSTMTEERLLIIVNNGKHPLYDCEFAHIQLTVLQLCRDELSKMLNNNSLQIFDSTSTNDNLSTPKGNIDLSAILTAAPKRGTSSRELSKYENGEIVHGTIIEGLKSVKGPKGNCTIDKRNGYAIGYSPKECDYETVRNIIFKVKVGKNLNNPSQPWYYATEIRPEE